MPVEAELIVNFDYIDDVPVDKGERALIDLSLVAVIENAWLSRLSDRDKKAIEHNQDNLPASVFDALDEVIFLQARTLGARLFLCDVVLRRLMKWDSLSNGPHLWKRFGEEMGTHIQVWRGQKKLPLDDRMRPFRDGLKQEYAVLHRWLRSQNPKRRPIPTDELLASAQAHVEKHPSSFKRLRMNWHLFQIFIQESPWWLGSQRPAPASFANEFIASFSNRGIESLRQNISSMSPRKL